MLSPKIKYKILFLAVLFIVSSGFRCTFFKSREVQKLTKPVKLVYWRVFDSPRDLSQIIADYQVLHPNISIEVEKLRFEEFEKKLLDAHAELRPPDIISLHYGWVKKYAKKDFIQPMPDKVTLVYQFEKTSLGIKKEVLSELRTTPTLTPTKIKNDFIPTVAKDVIIDNKIYGLPLSADTMVLFYNRDLLNKSRVSLPPSTWQEFQEAVKKTTFFDQNKNIVQAGATLGTSENIRRSADILMLLMRQNGATIIDGERVEFTKNTNSNYNPGIEALKFYTDFANQRKEVYTWNNEQPDALKAFADGKTAFYFGYSYDIPFIKSSSKNAVNFGIAKFPQIEGNEEKNSANYWVETVSKRTKYSDEAWDFILFMTKAEEAKKYLNAVRKPTALRALIEEQMQSDDLGVFASQLLTSETWYTGLDYNSAEKYVEDLIRSVNEGQLPEKMIDISSQKIQKSINNILE